MVVVLRQLLLQHVLFLERLRSGVSDLALCLLRVFYWRVLALGVDQYLYIIYARLAVDDLGLLRNLIALHRERKSMSIVLFVQRGSEAIEVWVLLRPVFVINGVGNLWEEQFLLFGIPLFYQDAGVGPVGDGLQ